MREHRSQRSSSTLLASLPLVIMSERIFNTNASAGQAPLLDPNDPAAMMKYVGAAIGSMIVLKLVYKLMFGLYIIAFPLVYLYAVQQCPSNDSFDAKKELKRVLRG